MQITHSETADEEICYGDNELISVVDVFTRPDYTLLLTFSDGKIAVYDARHLITKPIYAPLENVTFFLTAKIECGTVVWNDDIDIAPEHLYEHAKPKTRP